jgi:hypothetical protein
VRPGGSIVLTTPSVNYPNTNPKHFRHFSPESLRQLIDEVGGLRLAHLEGYGDSRTLKLFNMVKPVVDGRFLRIKPALNRMLAYCERRAERVPPERALGLIARIEVQP